MPKLTTIQKFYLDIVQRARTMSRENAEIRGAFVVRNPNMDFAEGLAVDWKDAEEEHWNDVIIPKAKELPKAGLDRQRAIILEALDELAAEEKARGDNEALGRGHRPTIGKALRGVFR